MPVAQTSSAYVENITDDTLSTPLPPAAAPQARQKVARGGALARRPWITTKKSRALKGRQK